MDVGKIANNIAAAANTYVSKETNKDNDVKKYSVSGKTIGQPKLSKEAKKYYEELQAKYKNLDFILVSKDMKEVAKANATSYANPSKMVVLIDEEKVERMSVDEKFRKQYEGIIESASKKLPAMQQELGKKENVKGFGMEIKEDGRKSFFAIMDKSFKDQASRIKEQRAKKSAKKKAEQKKSEKREKEEKLETKLKEKRLIEKKSSKEIITADSLEALKKKIDEYNYMQRADNVKSEEEKTIGSFFDIKG